MDEVDRGLISSWRKILRSLAGDGISEASVSTPSPTIASVFGDQPPRQINDEVYEIHRPRTRPRLEFVFFHGLELGDYRDSYWKSWLSADQSHCWPKTWLVEDWPDARVLSVSYDSSLMQTSTAGLMDLYQITENLEKTLIEDAGVGQNDCPLFLVGHSLGGLVIKALCTRAHERYYSQDRGSRDLVAKFLRNVKGLFFYATPHNGSILEHTARSSLSGPLMEDLKFLDFHSVRLNQDFSKFLEASQSTKLRGMGESLPTHLGNFFDEVVPEGSARFNKYDKYYTVPADHFGICKPDSKNRMSYKFLAGFVRDVIEKDCAEHKLRTRQGPSKRVHHRRPTRFRQTFSDVQGPSKFLFRADPRYIPLKGTEQKVMKALTNSKGPPVILLHGGWGTGKSALSRNLALHFQKTIEERIDYHGSYSQQAFNDGPFFDNVIYLECGSEVSLSAKQEELAEQLGLSASSSAARHVDVQEKSQFNSITTNLRSGLLKEKSLLIILDDVWESDDEFSSGPNFLQGMLDLGGRRVKWLITSHSQHVCDHLNLRDFLPIGIEEVKRDDARRILAALTGLEDSAIPKLKDVMDPIITKLHGNPLAMTCVALAMSKRKFKVKEEWQRLERDLLETLNSRGAIQMQGIGHGWSYWGAIRSCFQRLSTSQKNLLIFMHMCKGPSVPSGVIEYLFLQTGHGSRSEAFSTARDVLQRMQLVTLKTITHPILGEEEIWSMDDLLKEFIKRELFGDLDSKVSIREILARLKEGILFEKRILSGMVVIGVASLYFANDFRSEFSDKMATLPLTFEKDSDAEYTEEKTTLPLTPQIADMRRDVTDPITQLLVIGDNQWTSELRSSVREVFVEYVKDGIFDEARTSNLLNSPVSKIRMICALFTSAGNEYDSAVGQQIITTLHRLLERQTAIVLAAPPNCPSPQDCTLLVWISGAFAKSLKTNRTDSNVTHLNTGRFQTVLEGLKCGVGRVDENLGSVVGLVSPGNDVISPNDNVRIHCARALAGLASGGPDIKLRMMDFPGLLENLVEAMGKDDCLDLQENAVGAMVNLAASGTNETGLKMVDCPGVLDALVAGLESCKSQDVQQNSACALANLACLSDEIRSKIVTLEGVLRKLISAMVEGDNYAMNKHCARALECLTCGVDDIKVKIIDFPGLLENLVKAMGNDDCPDLQENASGIIVNLVKETLPNETLSKIVYCPGILDALLAGLENCKSQQVQQSSAWALGNLASMTDEIRCEIVTFEGALKKLGFAMVDVDNLDVNKQSAKAIANLAKGGDDIRMKVKLKFPGILDVLLDAAAKREKVDGGVRDAMFALTLLSPVKAKEMRLNSAAAYFGRGGGELILGHYKEALEDFDT